MDWTEFETVVRWIYETLGSKLGVEILGYGANCRRLGKSGVYHQIDVLTSHSDGLHTYLAGIECKWWNEKVNKDIVMKVDSIREDCNLDKAVIVTKVGFTEDATKYAVHTNVQLVELREHNLHISGNTLTKFYMHQQIDQPELVSTTVILDGMTSSRYKDHPLLQAADKFIYTVEKEVLDLNQLANDFLNTEVLHLQHSETVTSKRKFPKETKLKSHRVSGSIPVPGIQFCGFNRTFTKLDSDYFQNKIWLALKLVFEKKQFIVTLAGDIQPWENGEPIQGIVGRKLHLKSVGNARQFTIHRNVSLDFPNAPADPAGQIPI
jgi:hypothetical protein